MSVEIGLWFSVLSLTIWVVLLGFWGQFWRCDQQLTEQATDVSMFPTVCAIIPARNEADLLPITLGSLLNQNYPGLFTVFLVDDSSTDGTATIARNVAEKLDKTQQLQVLHAEPLPPGWTGKLWAIEQGIEKASKLTPEYFLLTDADIEHDIANLRHLVTKAMQENLDLVSIMVLLRCKSFWEKLLIPAFVFFFQKLYPFRWVNDPTKATAAAAGGCILIRPEALVRIGGIQVVRQALIDDCTLAHVVKSTPPTAPSSRGHIWLGLSAITRSLRPYPSLAAIWDMVARTAFTQLNYSSSLLIGTLLGMTLVYLVPPVSAILGTLTGNWFLAAMGLSGWLLMTFAYLPTIRFYKCPSWLACCLPIIAFLYSLMTLDSALRHWQGRGGAWKGRVYSE